jgi:hypothetical protein
VSSSIRINVSVRKTARLMASNRRKDSVNFLVVIEDLESSLSVVNSLFLSISSASEVKSILTGLMFLIAEISQLGFSDEVFLIIVLNTVSHIASTNFANKSSTIYLFSSSSMSLAG